MKRKPAHQREYLGSFKANGANRIDAEIARIEVRRTRYGRTPSTEFAPETSDPRMCPFEAIGPELWRRTER